jgi:hypothetical protein
MSVRHHCAAFVLIGAVAWTAAADTRIDVDVNVEVLTRGPVHEAFAEVVVFDPQPGVVVTKAPPPPIEEVLPDERPDGDHIVWVPGYSAWDDDRHDFVWVSGVWRDVPPGRQWVAGYWAETGAGFHWTSGYWASAAVTEVEYLPAPPPVFEVDPVIAAPSPEHTWVPGCWVWQGRYVWRPGHWVVVDPDWDWVPAHYVWTPRGYVFVDGYWDYTVKRRGVLFAPVYFQEVAYRRPGFHYAPATVIDVDVVSEHLFVRSRCSHYYFGDYYEVAYHHAGFAPAFALHVRRGGYDPIYTRMRWIHRHDHDWHNRLEAGFAYRRVHVEARPPRTLAAQLQLTTGSGVSVGGSVVLAKSLDQVAKSTTGSVRFTRVAPEEKQLLAFKSKEVRNFGEERKRLEASASVAHGPSKAAARGKAKLPSSPIAATASVSAKAKTPPSRPAAPPLDPTVQPKSRKSAAKAPFSREPVSGGGAPTVRSKGLPQSKTQRETMGPPSGSDPKPMRKMTGEPTGRSKAAPTRKAGPSPSLEPKSPSDGPQAGEPEAAKQKEKAKRTSKQRTQKTKAKDKP